MDFKRNRTLRQCQLGQKWKKTLNTELNEWQTFFKSARKICKENKLREFQFKFLHRVVVTKKELFRFGIKQNSDCLFCGEEDSIEHTFINCQFTKSFRKVYLGGLTLRITPTYFLHWNNLYLDFPKIYPTIAAFQQNLTTLCYLWDFSFILVNFITKHLLSQTLPTK